MGEKIKFGWAEENITPDQKIKLAGQFFERISEYVETPIAVTALAIESGDSQMVICSADIIHIKPELLKAVREKLEGNVPGLDVKNIILNATHVHTAMLYTPPEFDSLKSVNTLDVIKEYMQPGQTYKPRVSGEAMDTTEVFFFLVDKIAACIKKAWENRKTGCYSNAFGRAVVGHCRRVVYDDGSAKMWGDSNKANFVSLEGGNDSGIELIYVFDEKKKLTGVVANIACPAQVVEQRSFISSDYWGKVRILLREKFGEDLFVLGLCSAAGDQCPRDMIRWIEPETPIDDPNVAPRTLERVGDPSMYDIAGTWKIGKRVAREIIDVYDEAVENIKEEEIFAHTVETFEVPLRRATISEYEEAIYKIKEFFRLTDKTEFNYSDNAHLHVYAGTIIRYEQQQTENMVPMELHTARLGDVAFATNPFELFLDYGNQIRARSKAKQTILIQLACDTLGYLPTKKAEEGSHYSAYISGGVTGHIGGELLVRKSLERINEKF